MVNAVITNPASCFTQVAGLYFKIERTNVYKRSVAWCSEQLHSILNSKFFACFYKEDTY